MPHIQKTSHKERMFNQIRVGLIGSTACFSLLFTRFLITGSTKYSYLVWNVTLAWIAWGFGVALLYSLVSRRTKWLSLSMFVGWILFLPNTFYLLTDMIHPVLSYDKVVGFNGSDFSSVPDGAMILFDISLVGLGVWVGWYLGISSLIDMWSWATKKIGLMRASLLAQVVIIASAYAIYLGRSPRLNSWDVIARPLSVVKVALEPLLDPAAFSDAWVLTVLYVVLISTIFWSIALCQSKEH